MISAGTRNNRPASGTAVAKPMNKLNNAAYGTPVPVNPTAKKPMYVSVAQMRQTIKRLGAILRVADGFDRGHASAVAEIKVRWMDRALRLTAVPVRQSSNLRLELWGASRKSNLLAEVAGVPVEIVAPDGTVMTYEDEVGAAD